MNRIKSMLAVVLIAAGCTGVQDKAGETYKGWNPGEMEIHHIHTGMGEANLIIMPDGTSMQIDAGDLGPHAPSWEMRLIESLDISESDKEKIYHLNAEKLLGI